MKKVFAGMMAGVFAVIMCASFAACGKKGIDAENIVGKEVTEAQWDAAFEELMSEESVYTVRAKITSEVPQEEGEFTASVTVEYSGTYVQNGVDMHLNGKIKYLRCSGDMIEVYGDEEAKIIANYIKQDFIVALDEYVEKNNDGYYYYGASGYSQMYYRRSGPVVDPNEVNRMKKKDGFACGNIATLFKDCKGNFDLFRYDSNKKGYMFTNAEVDEEYENTVIKFNEDGKLIAIFGDEGEHGFRDDRKIEFHFLVEYTAEEIVFPTNYTEE